MEATADALFNDRVRQFGEFIDPADPDAPTAVYAVELRKMLATDRARLVVSLDDLREFDRKLWHGCLQQPSEFLPPLQQAVKDACMSMRDPNQTALDEDTIFTVGFSGTFGAHLLSPRTLQSPYLGKLVCIEGIVTRCTIVRPKVSRTIHYGPKTNEFFSREYRDQTTSFDPMPTTTTYPSQDSSGNPLVMEYGLSTYRDHQMVSIQEMPERAPPGQLPRGVDVVMDDDLVDLCKPGDRVQIVGVYRSVGGSGTANERGSMFRSLVIGNNCVLLSSKGTDSGEIESITDQDIRSINRLSKQPDIFALLAKSLAPSIFGMDYIKQAVLLQLLGGVEKNLANGTHIRGDINVLMVGDPSTAKSQMLRFVLNTASLAIATTGRGSTGVGLTAAVTVDKDTGERRLEAGAMVMADRGIVCVDEFDKMNDADRVAIHEVMEQQTVTISKAGIHTTLNARCAVLAAANPAYGQYDPHKEPHRNIALPDSLLSRFDLLFVVTDEVNATRDRRISDHVMRMHQFLPQGQAEGTPQRELQTSALSVREPASESVAAPVKVYTDASETLLSVPFVKRYIEYAKIRLQPVLTDIAVDQIANIYSDLRNDPLALGQRRTAPVTARTLETMIRLSTAHAKARLSHEVELVDVMAAEGILRYAMFKEVRKPGLKPKRRRMEDSEDLQESRANPEDSSSEELDLLSDGEDDDDENDENDDANDANDEGAAASENANTNTNNNTNNNTNSPAATPSRASPDVENLHIDDRGVPSARSAEFEKIVGELMASGSVLGSGSALFNDLRAAVNERATSPFSVEEVSNALHVMHAANKLFFDENEGQVYSI